MRIVADENIDAPIIEWLRTQGHDVLAIGERSPGMGDVAVLPLAVDENRVILTFDLDFGDLAVRRGHPVPGVILLRIRTRDPLGLMAILQTA